MQPQTIPSIKAVLRVNNRDMILMRIALVLKKRKFTRSLKGLDAHYFKKRCAEIELDGIFTIQPHHLEVTTFTEAFIILCYAVSFFGELKGVSPEKMGVELSLIEYLSGDMTTYGKHFATCLDIQKPNGKSAYIYFMEHNITDI